MKQLASVGSLGNLVDQQEASDALDSKANTNLCVNQKMCAHCNSSYAILFRAVFFFFFATRVC